MTTNTQHSTQSASAKAVQTGILPMTPQVKKNIAAVRSAYNAYRRSGGKESMRAWVRPQVEAALKAARGTTSGQTEKPMDGIGAGTVVLALAEAALASTGPLGVVAGLLVDSIIDAATSGDGGGGDGGGSGDGSHGDNPGGGGSPA